MLLGDRGTCVWTTCPRLLPESAVPGAKLVTPGVRVQRPNHYATRPHRRCILLPNCLLWTLWLLSLSDVMYGFCWCVQVRSRTVMKLYCSWWTSMGRLCRFVGSLVLTHTHACLTALFPGIPRWAGTRKVKPIWILLKQETVSGSGVSWAICKSAPHFRQTTTPAPYHSVFYRPDGLPATQPTTSKHCLQCFCSNTLCVLLGGNVTSAGWQVTPCDPIWHVCSHSGEASC